MLQNYFGHRFTYLNFEYSNTPYNKVIYNHKVPLLTTVAQGIAYQFRLRSFVLNVVLFLLGNSIFFHNKSMNNIFSYDFQINEQTL
jgi:hypothetical protein